MSVNTNNLKLVFALLFLAATPLVAVNAQRQSSSSSQPERFDHQVRNDFFAGYAGNAEALKRGMTKCEERLKIEPDHPEALVWHGGGLMFLASQLFAKQDWQRGIEQQRRGLEEMDRAVAFRPHDVAVLVPRAAMLVTYSRYVPGEKERAEMLARVVSDYEEVYRQQKSIFEKISPHSRGELIFGLAEAYLRLGGDENRSKAHALLKMALMENDYAKEADVWSKAPADAKPGTFAHRCIGCHI